MSSICFILRMHQPYRLRNVTVFEKKPLYFDDQRTREQCRAHARRGYVPVSKLLLELVRRWRGRFRLCCSISGTLLEQLERWEPQVIDHLRKLTRCGGVEWLGDTYYHSLSGLYSPTEFRAQVEAHRDRIEQLFGQAPTTFWDNDHTVALPLLSVLRTCGFRGIVGGPACAAGTIAGSWSSLPAATDMAGLLEPHFERDDCRIDPDLFQTVADRLDQAGGPDEPLGLHLDCGVFCRPRWVQAGLLPFFAQWPAHMLARGTDFLTAREWMDRPSGSGPAPQPLTSARQAPPAGQLLDGPAVNNLQENVLHELYALEPAVLATGDRALIGQWRRLQTADHVFAMRALDRQPRSTSIPAQPKPASPENAAQGPDPWETPYDAYISVKNILCDLRRRTDIT